MTDIPIGLIAGIILAPLILTCFAIAIIAHKHVDAIEHHLPNCAVVKTMKDVYSNAGLIGKVMRGGVIGVLLFMPVLSARRGLIDAQEFQRLPSRYKKLLVIPLIICAFLLFSLAALRLFACHEGG